MNSTNLNITNVIKRYSKEYDIPNETSINHFVALKSFLELATKSKVPCFPDKTIDNAWHTFIIHTKVYRDYCLNNFKKFIHHNPLDKIITPIKGYYCSYDNETKKMDSKLMFVTQAVCDGGGDDCASCTDDD